MVIDPAFTSCGLGLFYLNFFLGFVMNRFTLYLYAHFPYGLSLGLGRVLRAHHASVAYVSNE